MRRAARRDANEAAVVEALRARGAVVTLLAHPGVPDLLVGYRGVTELLEVKMPLGPKGGASDHQDLTETQEEWWGAWTGRPAIVVRSVEDALLVLGRIEALDSTPIGAPRARRRG